MARFVYQVRDPRGGTLAGALTAPSLGEASRLLRSEGKIIVDLREQAEATRPASGTISGRVKRQDVIFFANQLAVMVDTGVPLPDALDAIAEQSDSPAFRGVLADLADQVKGGVDFSAALAKYPKLFGNLFVAMVKASEASGTMGRMLTRVAHYLEQQHAVRRRVKGALAYPLAMIGFCIAVVIAMLVFVLPRFEKIYMGKSALLPAPTRLLLALSNGIVSYWPIILAVLAVGGTSLYLYFRRPQGQEMLDVIRIRMPILGGMFRKACLARSLRTLATMVATGVSVLEGLQITAAVAGNVLYARVWDGLSERLKGGASLSDELLKQPLVPHSIAQMVSAGERTGKLAPVLDRVAGFCEEELDVAIRTSTSFIEPVMIIIMGVIVGGVAMALLLPVFSLSKVITAH